MPSVLVACVTTVLTLAATFLAGWSVALPVLVGVPLLWGSTRWYLRRAPEGYLAERAAYAEVNGTITETVDGARTVDALGLGERRIRRTLDDLRSAYGIERYTLRLRMVWFPTVELTYLLPVSLCLLWGGYLVRTGHASVAAVTAVTLYVVQLVDPVDELLSWLDEVQVGRGLTRPDHRRGNGSAGPRPRAAPSPPTTGSPRPKRRTPIARATTCCTRCPSRSDRASGSPSSVRRGPGSPRSAGCSPASIRPRAARSRSAGCRWSTCRWTSCAARWPSSRRSTMSSSARWRTTSGWPARTPPTSSSRRRWSRSTRWRWAQDLPLGLQTTVGTGGRA